MVLVGGADDFCAAGAASSLSEAAGMKVVFV